MTSGHRSIDHTADLALEIWAPDLPALLVEAARALVEILTDGAKLEAVDERTIELDAIDDEDRLVRFLNEVIWLALGQQFLLVDAELELTPTGLRGRIRGSLDARAIVTEVKSATYHDLRLTRTNEGLRAQVVIDV
ncbi:MAG TPA: archease [Nannocystaceae bacterium]|nr:archease [Nannocystaceae bacterium]